MRDYRDAKAMAQTLRDALKQKSVSLTHSESLELIAKILGFHDWNVLSAKIQSDNQSVPAPTPIRISTVDDRPPVPLPEGADLPVVPIRDIVLFPHMIAPLFVGREKTRRAIDYAMAADKRIVAVTQRQAGDDDPTHEGLYGVGVIASVIDFMPLADGTLRVITKSLERVTLTRCIAGEMLAAKITPFAETRGDGAQAETLARTVVERVQAYLNINFASLPYSRLPHIREPGVLADAIAPLLPIERADEKRPAGGLGSIIPGARLRASPESNTPLPPNLSLPGLTGQSSNLCAIDVAETLPQRRSGGYWIARSSRAMTARGEK